MGAKFVGGDREQVFLMPPSVRDWVPEGHLVWTVLDAVAELDLSVIYADYRADGHGRPAYEPSMMVALLLYAYARGTRSSRGIERECVEDVAFRVVTGNVAPDHSTIAEFRVRHERPLADLFSGVLGLCARAGMVAQQLLGDHLRRDAARGEELLGHVRRGRSSPARCSPVPTPWLGGARRRRRRGGSAAGGSATLGFASGRPLSHRAGTVAKTIAGIESAASVGRPTNERWPARVSYCSAGAARAHAHGQPSGSRRHECGLPADLANARRAAGGVDRRQGRRMDLDGIAALAGTAPSRRGFGESERPGPRNRCGARRTAAISAHNPRARRIGMRSAPRRSTVSGVSSLPSRPLPYVGMPVLIVYLAAAEPDIINEVADGGRTLTVDRTGLTLRRTIGRLIRAGEPS
jgi:transposase